MNLNAFLTYGHFKFCLIYFIFYYTTYFLIDMTLLTKLNWRYATKRMDGRNLSSEKLDNILSAIRLSPSSLGLQPYKVWVVTDKKKRQEIYEKSCHQPQVIEGSHLLVFVARNTLTDKEINEYISLIASERQISEDSLAGFKNTIHGFATAKQQNPEDYSVWSARQAYIALGIGLAAAADMDVDATPMEGFDPEVMDEILGLKEMGLHSVVLMMLGHRDENADHLLHAKKVRKPSELLFEHV
jgi:nitroreductase/dihydropteridine reductase